MKRNTALAPCVALIASLACTLACEKKESAPAPTPAPTGAATASPGHGHGGPVIALGTATIGTFDVSATRDEGAIVAGKDAPIDVTVTPASGSTANVVAVRFWIGTQDAAGSVKAKADIENPAEPNRWHTHAEIPDPIPAGAMLWIEIEDENGGVSAGSVELKQ